MRTAVLLSTLAIAAMASAQVFQSDLENWTGSTPDGWVGSKTNIDLSGVTQVTDNPHGGLYAVRLANTTTSHKRFTTQPLTVVSGQNYTITFWVRGSGSVRTSLFDGRPGTSSGYAPYNSYVTATSTWTMVTQSVAAANDTTGAEFIISVLSTVAPEHIVVDDVNITEAGALAAVSIHDIQYTTAASGDSPYNGQTVLTGGIVTADLPAATAGYFVQSGSGAWSGVYVYDVDNAPAIGDSLTFSAAVSEYNGNTELSGLASYTVVSSGNTVPAPLDVATGDVSLEPLESVLIRVVNAPCTEAPGGANFGKYKLDDGSGFAIVGKAIYTTTPSPVVGDILTVTGVNYYAFAEYDIEPRMTSDVDFAADIAEPGMLATVSMSPNPTKDILNVELGKAAGRNVEYTLIDMQGRTVLEGVFTNERGQVNVGGMPAGMYHITLRSNTLVKTFAVQVAH